jgi:hypothetical protein
MARNVMDIKRNELLATKGFITKEDDDLIDKTPEENLRQRDPDLFNFIKSYNKSKKTKKS